MQCTYDRLKQLFLASSVRYFPFVLSVFGVQQQNKIDIKSLKRSVKLSPFFLRFVGCVTSHVVGAFNTGDAVVYLPTVFLAQDAKIP